MESTMEDGSDLGELDGFYLVQVDGLKKKKKRIHGEENSRKTSWEGSWVTQNFLNEEGQHCTKQLKMGVEETWATRKHPKNKSSDQE